MSWKYSPLAQDQPSDAYISDLKQAEKTSSYQFFSFKKPFLILLVAANICLWVIAFKRPSKTQVPVDYAKTHDLTTEWANFHWHTAYSPKGQNHTKSDMLWEQILPSHGFVAVDRQWADEHHWPVSMYLPSDHDKGVYLLEAYHQLHCLRILRKTLWEAVEKRPYTYPLSHSEHCFDALRQSVVCNADNTPLYTFGDFTAGDGQLHQCRNWTELRNYATEQTACYKDTLEDVPLGDHFGFCDEGDDGVIGLL